MRNTPGNARDGPESGAITLVCTVMARIANAGDARAHAIEMAVPIERNLRRVVITSPSEQRNGGGSASSVHPDKEGQLVSRAGQRRRVASSGRLVEELPVVAPNETGAGGSPPAPV